MDDREAKTYGVEPFVNEIGGFWLRRDVMASLWSGSEVVDPVI